MNDTESCAFCGEADHAPACPGASPVTDPERILAKGAYMHGRIDLANKIESAIAMAATVDADALRRLLDAEVRRLSDWGALRLVRDDVGEYQETRLAGGVPLSSDETRRANALVCTRAWQE